MNLHISQSIENRELYVMGDIGRIIIQIKLLKNRKAFVAVSAKEYWLEENVEQTESCEEVDVGDAVKMLAKSVPTSMDNIDNQFSVYENGLLLPLVWFEDVNGKRRGCTLKIVK